VSTLNQGGNFVAKMFYGDMSRAYVNMARNYFDEVHLHHPKASRSTSSELYVIGLGFRHRRASPRIS
jgi:23S rRNA (uridine2552-2'-O)-methyltransferase